MTAQEVTAWVRARTVARQAQEQARAERRECRRDVARAVEWEAQRVAWVRAHEANPPKRRPSDVRNEGWWAERKAGATYTSIAKREQRSKDRVRMVVHHIQCRKLWAWRHPTDETVIRGRTMLDDEDGRITTVTH